MLVPKGRFSLDRECALSVLKYLEGYEDEKGMAALRELEDVSLAKHPGQKADTNQSGGL